MGTLAEAEVWVVALPGECAHRVCFVQPRGEAPLQRRFLQTIAKHIALLTAIFPLIRQAVVLKTLQEFVG